MLLWFGVSTLLGELAICVSKFPDTVYIWVLDGSMAAADHSAYGAG